ncbi:N5-glutamine methyltransferase family protein [Brevibacterium paucivorans]|uniref:N5-glutamine methyltransferase family protein n=1 Tax=Brevibacterium paucivorans TaxID=170994 RepID=UPI0021553BAB|nr:class I SAM-dependent methyltransferase [Brevibacterium paucivorans]
MLTIDQTTGNTLRHALHHHRFTPAGLRELWGADIDDALTRNNAAPARWFLTGRTDPLSVLANLFVCAATMDAEVVRTSLGTHLFDSAAATGALLERAGTVHAPFALRAIEVPPGLSDPADEPAPDSTPDHIWLFSDHGTLTRDEPVNGDFVLGVGGAGRTLLNITPRTLVHTALDLGTGCGIQAIALARHCDHVIATDISPRALAFTRANATLNGAHNIETRQGSLFEPTPEQFDLIVSNPPFVITPQGHTTTLEYRDGGHTGDQLMRTLLTQLPDHLPTSGTACLLGNWEITPAINEDPANPTDPTEAPTNWVPNTVDISVIEREQLTPAHYAETWIRDGGVVPGSPRWNADTAAWLDDFASRGVTRIAFGWIQVRARATGAPIRHFESRPGPLGANPGGIAQFLDVRFDLIQWLNQADDNELLDTAFIRNEGVVEHRHFTPGDESPTTITIEVGTGFAREMTVDTAFAGCIGVADGSLTLRAVAHALAQLLDVEPDMLTSQLVAQVRDAVVSGILYPNS